jgi:hypothetical protein
MKLPVVERPLRSGEPRAAPPRTGNCELFTRRAGMNKTENAWADILDAWKKSGSVHEWWFEGITFKLGDDCRYTPDFLVQRPDGKLECHEVKGFWRDDAKAKIRVAAGMFPFRFVAVSRRATNRGGGWDEKEFGR